MKFPIKEINKQKKLLSEHALLNNQIINDMSELQIFMEHHVFAVWDFMSLVKSLQNHLCKSSDCWVPNDKSELKSKSARLINEIVLAEETDYNLDGLSIISHFELYCESMIEIGADVTQIKGWISSLDSERIPINFNNNLIPNASRPFVEQTFEFIKTKKPHIIAAAFAFGREKIIPEMFERLVTQLNLTAINCPKLFYYLARHIEIDGDEHGPASEALVENLCEDNPLFIKEAENAAIEAIQSRIKFWDDVAHEIKQDKRIEEESIITSIAV